MSKLIEAAFALTPLDSFDAPPANPSQYEEVQEWRDEQKRGSTHLLPKVRKLSRDGGPEGAEAFMAVRHIENLILDPEFDAKRGAEIDRIADALLAALPDSEKERMERVRAFNARIRANEEAREYWAKSERTRDEIHALLDQGDETLDLQGRLNLYAPAVRSAVAEWWLDVSKKPGPFQHKNIPHLIQCCDNGLRLALLRRYPCIHNILPTLDRNWDTLNESLLSVTEEIIKGIHSAHRRRFREKLARARANWESHAARNKAA